MQIDNKLYNNIQMKINHIPKLFIAVISALSLLSCNDNNSDYNYSTPSSDAQIYSFSIAAIPNNAIDSINYPIMAKTLFTIDQSRDFIYNHDSLPYGTEIGRFATTLRFGPNSPSYVQVIYPNDSITIWNSSDSIDYRLNPKLRVFAQNGTPREYSIDIRVHQVDPDTIIWTNTNSDGTSLNLPNGVGLLKTILSNNKFYCYSINAGTISLYTTNRNTVSWTKETSLNGLNSSIIIESIVLYNNTFYAADINGNVYKSADGINWNNLGNKNVVNILGIVPTDSQTTGVLMLLTKNSGDYYISETTDMNTITPLEKVNNEFPVQGKFTSATRYNPTDSDRNILVIEGGLDASNSLNKMAWMFKNSSKGVQITSSIINSDFEVKEGLRIFPYNNLLYALTGNQLFTSSWGHQWVEASSKQTLNSNIPKASAQSIVVDEDNYIWILGGLLENNSTYTNEVWKGRLNKIVP